MKEIFSEDFKDALLLAALILTRWKNIFRHMWLHSGKTRNS